MPLVRPSELHGASSSLPFRTFSHAQLQPDLHGRCSRACCRGWRMHSAVQRAPLCGARCPAPCLLREQLPARAQSVGPTRLPHFSSSGRRRTQSFGGGGRTSDLGRAHQCSNQNTPQATRNRPSTVLDGCATPSLPHRRAEVGILPCGQREGNSQKTHPRRHAHFVRACISPLIIPSASLTVRASMRFRFLPYARASPCCARWSPRSQLSPCPLPTPPRAPVLSPPSPTPSARLSP